MVNSTKTKGEYYFDRTFDGTNYVNYTSEGTYSFKTWQFDAQYDPDKVLSDYNNGTVPQIIERLAEANNQKTSGYGFDAFTEEAKTKRKDIMIDCIESIINGSPKNRLV